MVLWTRTGMLDVIRCMQIWGWERYKRHRADHFLLSFRLTGISNLQKEENSWVWPPKFRYSDRVLNSLGKEFQVIWHVDLPRFCFVVKQGKDLRHRHDHSITSSLIMEPKGHPDLTRSTGWGDKTMKLTATTTQEKDKELVQLDPC